MLKISHLYAGYDNLPILHDISFDVGRGKLVLLVGPNGAGKSTVLKTIVGIAHLKSGVIKFGDKDITGLPSWKIIGNGIAYCPQGDFVFLDMTANENLLSAFYAKGRPVDSSLKEEVLGIFPVLKDKLQLKASQLSGGEQKMLGLARALLMQPKLLLLDEPFLGLSPSSVENILEKILEIRDHGIGVLMVEHRVDEVLSEADSVVGMKLGRLHFILPSKDVDLNCLKELYL